MSKKLYEESNIQEIASTIREKKGTQDTYKVSQMAEAMSDLIGPPAYNNMILAQDTQPDNEYNKVWFDTDADDEYTFPEIDDNNVSTNDTWSSEKINTENNTIKTNLSNNYRKAADQDTIDNAQNIEINSIKTNLTNNYRKAAEQDVIDNAQNNNISQLHEDIYDSTVGLDTKAPAIYKSDSGDIVSFYDGADSMPLKNLTVNFEPQQDLHGYDHPWPAGGGKNLLPISMDNESSVEGGVTVTVVRDTDGNAIGINLNGTCTNSTTVYITGTTVEQGVVEPRTITLSPGQYYLMLADGGTGATVKGAGNWEGWKYGSRTSRASEIKEVTEDSPTKITTGSVAIYLYSGNTYSNVTIKPMICSVSDVTTVDSKGNTVIDYTFSPYSNICPITGYTGCNITRTGKNLLPISISGDTKTVAGVTFTVVRDADGNAVGINLNGTCVQPGTYAFTDAITLKAGSYQLVSTPGAIVKAAGDFGLWIAGTPESLQPMKEFTEDTTGYIGVMLSGNETLNNVFIQPMICRADETDFSFAPCFSETYNTSWETEAGTVYGGTLDVTTGLLTVTWGLIAASNFDWAQGASPTEYRRFFNNTMIGGKAKKPGLNNILSNKYGPHTSSAVLFSIRGNNETRLITIRDVNFVSDIEGFKASLIGVQIAYELENPITYQLTTKQITTLLGTNHVWSDIGPIELTYPADTKTYVDNYQTDDIASLQEMSSFFEPIPGTTETVSFDQNGKPASIVHTNGTDALRTDSFVWTDNTVTETRTLANGKHIVMATDLTTLVTTISEIQEGT